MSENRYCYYCDEELIVEDDYLSPKNNDICEECYFKSGYNDSVNDPDDYLIDDVGFADPGGNSALRAATANNPRDRPCPTCGVENKLTRIDEQRGYQCDRCADIAEGMGW